MVRLVDAGIRVESVVNRDPVDEIVDDGGSVVDDAESLIQRRWLCFHVCLLWLALTCVRSGERDRIAAADDPALDHVGIGPHVRLIVLCCGAQDPGVPRQVALRERRHHATGTTAGNP